MVKKEEIVDASMIKFVFEQAKKQTADMVIIPQFLHNSTGSFDIAGEMANSISSSSRFQVFESFHDSLWNDSSLVAIGLWYKDISPFLKVIGDHGVEKLQINYNVYEVNGNNIGIAVSLTTAKPIMIKKPNEDVTECVFSPVLPLLPIMDPFKRVKDNLTMWSMLPKIMDPITLTEDELFMNIWSGKTSDGALEWKPDVNRYPENLRPYIIYLSKCMFAFSKSDKVYLEFRDIPPYLFKNEFMCMITVQRVSKKQYSTHTYLFHGIKVV